MGNILSRSVEAFDLLAANPRGLSVTELAEQMKTSKSTSSRLLASLYEMGLVEKDAAQRHFLDVRFWTWGTQAVRRLPVLDVARPHIAAVVRAEGVSVFLAVARGDQAIYLESTQLRNGGVSPELVSYVVPVYACAPGKAMLAFSQPQVIQSVINGGLVKYTRHTHATKAELEAELADIRQKGYAVNRGEHNDSGRLAVAVPIFDQTGLPVASVCFFGFRQEEEMLAKTDSLIQLGQTISSSLGYSHTMHVLVG